MAFVTRWSPFTPNPPLQVEVNLNAITEDGLIRVDGTDFRVHPQVSSLVVVVEPEDEVRGLARVARVNERTNLVYLDIIWESLHDLESSLHMTDTSSEPAVTAPADTGWRRRRFLPSTGAPKLQCASW